MVDPSDGLDRLDPDEGGRPDATEVELVPVGEEQPRPARLTSVNRKHAAMAAAVVLASAIFISRAGESVPTAVALRTTDFSGPELTAADDEDEAEDDADDDQRYRVPSWFEDEDTEAFPYDDELASGEEDITIDTFDSFEDFNDFNDFNDFGDFEDEDYTTLPRRPSSNNSPRPSRPATSPRRPTTTTTTTTVVAETTTTESTSTTSTTAAIATTSAPATSTTLPAAKWEPATAGLTCAAPLNVSVRNDLLVASAGSKLYTTTDGGQSWTERHRGDRGPAAPISAVQQHPATRDRFWVASIDGVFEAADSRAQLVELGDLFNVQSLGLDDADVSQIALLAVADPAATLYHWTPASPTTWQPLDAQLPPGTVSGEFAVIGGRVLLGTDRGVFELSDDDAFWNQKSEQAVKGAPVTLNGVSYWLLADGGVIQNGGGPNWLPVIGGAASRPDGSAGLTAVSSRLVATGGSGLLASSDGGANWTAFSLATEYRPSGVSYSTADEATFVWRSDCAGGSTSTNFIMKLADTGS